MSEDVKILFLFFHIRDELSVIGTKLGFDFLRNPKMKTKHKKFYSINLQLKASYANSFDVVFLHS